MNTIRSPIVSVLGHVDHGKSSVLDAIRDTNILATEAGAITQAIGASIIPAQTIQNKCGSLLNKLGVKLTIPGLLFIDTPGHAAFTSLRKRGGALADIAIVVVDINEGFKPQTIEAIEILRAAKRPFIICANKLDLLPRYVVPKDCSTPVLGSITQQTPQVQQAFEMKMYGLVGQLYEKFQITADRFDRIDDFTQQVAIIPISAKTQLGISETLMVLGALAQKYLEQNLILNEAGPAKGTILEVKEEKGLGKTMDVIVYNGTLHIGDMVVIGTLGEPLVTKVKAMFEPAPLSEMRDKKSSFQSVKEVVAATGVKISCPEMDGILSGMPVLSCDKTTLEATKQQVRDETNTENIETEDEGIIIKADNIGSLEALNVLLKEKGFKIRRATVGEISKKDVTEAEANYEIDPLQAAILGFNVKEVPSSDKVKIITSDVIYRIIESYEEWAVEERRRLEAKQLEGLTKPAKVEVLQNCIFRQSNPCVVGVEVQQGTLTTGMRLMKANGNKLTTVKEIQHDKKNVQKLEKGKQAAISLPNVTAGRQLGELDVFYTDVSPIDFREFKKHAKLLTPEEKDLLREIAEIKRKENSLWGM